VHAIEFDAILRLAKNQLRGGKVAEAEAMYRKVLGVNPQCAEAIHFMGLAALRRGKPDEAMTLILRSIELEDTRPEFHNNLATVLGQMNRAPEALGAAQRAIDLRDEFPEAWSNKGVALENLGRPGEAIDAYRRAVEVQADYVEALSNLGNLLSRMDRHEDAIARLRKIVELRPRDAGARKNLGNASRRAGKPLDAVTAYRMAVEIDARDADAYNNLGAALQESGKTVEAEQVLRTCLSINRDHPDAHWNLGLALLTLGRWREGWVEYEWRRHLREDLGQRRNFPQPAWQGSPLEGMHLLVLCEQGLGDSIQFVRYVPLLVERGARVTVECQARLRPLLKCMENENVKVIARGEPLPRFDMYARLMTLPHILGSTPDNVPNQVPYLSLGDDRISNAAALLERAFAASPCPRVPESLKVGIAWQGNTAHKGDRFRSIALSLLVPLARVEGVHLISLQKGHGSEQIAANPGMNVLEWSDASDTTAEALLDTAAVMKQLDLVMSVDSAIAHLAGALAVPVWVAMPLAPDWRWLLDREDTPWYPTMKLFRQRMPNDWPEVISAMAAELKSLSARANSAESEAKLAAV
jgi:tetratricopeptide (TPR) repeat protein